MSLNLIVEVWAAIVSRELHRYTALIERMGLMLKVIRGKGFY